jgi:hypothetical protein
MLFLMFIRPAIAYATIPGPSASMDPERRRFTLLDLFDRALGNETSGVDPQGTEYMATLGASTRFRHEPGTCRVMGSKSDLL